MTKWYLVSPLLCLLSLHAYSAECTNYHSHSAEVLAELELEKPQSNERKLKQPFRVREVRLVRQNIFPTKRYWLARQANRFNTLTRADAIYSVLPFTPGDLVRQKDLAEAERLLRNKAFLFDARVLARRVCGETVDVDVVTRDVWTLNPNVGFSRSGGDNRTNLGLSDSNFLGSGKGLSFELLEDRDRQSLTLDYRDPNLFGSRWTARLQVADSDDGDRLAVRVTRPFFRLDAPWSVGFAADRFRREQDLEFLSEDLFVLEGETTSGEAFFGRGWRESEQAIQRLWFGASYQEEIFDFPADFPGPAQTERRFAGPFVAWSRIPDQFKKRANLNRVGVSEDIALGLSAAARLTWSSDAFGGEGDFLLYNFSISGQWLVGEQNIFGVRAGWNGRYDLDERDTQDALAFAAASYRWRHGPRWLLLAEGSYVQTRDLDLDTQLTLGGETGLRGYPSRFQIGDRRFQFRLEERYFTDWFPLGLFRVGYAAFFDAGRADFGDEPPAYVPTRDGDFFDTLYNVGLGLRIESVRTRRDRVVHIDIAKPLVDGPNVDSLQFTIGLRQSL